MKWTLYKHGGRWAGRIMDGLRYESEVHSNVQKDFHQAMKKKGIYDYPRSPTDKEPTPNTRRILDYHFDNWMTTDPNHNNVKKVDLRSPYTRTAIGEQPTAWRKGLGLKFPEVWITNWFDPSKVMIYERDNDYKYVVSPYERTGMANISYWHQHITKTAVSYDMPENVSCVFYY